MIEIALLYWLGKKVAAAAKEKGRPPVGWVCLFIALWVGGELIGLMIGAEIAQRKFIFTNDVRVVAYLAGLAGAAIGASIILVIMNVLPDSRASIRPRTAASSAAPVGPMIPIPPSQKSRSQS